MSKELHADITGTVWQLCALPGDFVPANEPIMVLESMKMEIPVTAEEDVRIVSITVAKGDPVEEGQVIAILEETV